MTTTTGNTAIIRTAFRGLDDEAVDLLKQVAVRRTFDQGAVLCKEGEPGDSFYVITGGRVVITRDVEGNDEDFVVGFLGPGGFFGEMSLVTGEMRSATVTAIMDTDVLEITKEYFDEVFNSSPAMARNILETLSRIIRETDQRAIDELQAQNEELAQAYAELEAAQADRIARAALEAQLDVAARAQRSLLPRDLPVVPGFEFGARFEPARQIGGDFYGVGEMKDGRVSVFVADVSDKGAHAALFMAVARTLFLTEQHHYIEPLEVVQAVHRGLIEASNYDMFVTAVYGLLDIEQRTFRYVRAGHDEPILIRADGEAEFLGGTGRFLGLWAEPAPVFDEETITFNPGDTLILYSDGVTDMRDPENQPYGRDRVMEVARSLRMYDADRIAKSIYNVVQQHRAGVEAFDDFTLLVIRAKNA
ncbi:MAG: SpoIIE family protein phosphatase [Chloroflexi bacterium]|nr:SpoIIE family protein phosphatase [Chloroflexota bacterium]